MKELSDEEIMNLEISDLRELTPQEKQQDDFRRMFQMLGLIYKNQMELKDILASPVIAGQAPQSPRDSASSAE